LTTDKHQHSAPVKY